MKILIIADEEWNDYVIGNGVLTNWFTGFDAEFAEIYTSPGLPINNICDRYFQITDEQMVKSIIGGKRAGGIIFKSSNPYQIEAAKSNASRKGVYGFFKKLSLKFYTPVQLLRDFIWRYGRYNKKELQFFVEDFHPDIVFCPRLATQKLMRLEALVYKMTDAPFVAFTGDNEVALSSFRPTLAWWRRWRTNKMFKKHCKIYSHYLMHSQDQAEGYAKEYGLSTSTFYKCGDFVDSFTEKSIGKPIRLVYAGRLYCNRWFSLVEIGTALQIIYCDGIKMVLDIYTQEKLTKKQFEALSEDKFIYLKGSVVPSELKMIYKNADIALHVESMDEYYRMVTRVSFSTKIIDLMSSTCAIMAICWEKHCGFQYLQEQDAAFCVSNYCDILPLLKSICDNPSLIQRYAKRSYNCGVKNHSREKVHGQLQQVFDKVIVESKYK